MASEKDRANVFEHDRCTSISWTWLLSEQFCFSKLFCLVSKTIGTAVLCGFFRLVPEFFLPLEMDRQPLAHWIDNPHDVFSFLPGDGFVPVS